MQYAQIIPNITLKPKESSAFTYQIPPEILPEIQKGCLVKIPFGQQIIEGLVLDIKKRRPLAAQNKKIRKILSILYPQNLATPTQLQLATWLSKYYFSSLSQTLFSQIPLPPQKRISKSRIITKTKTPQGELFKSRLKNLQKIAKSVLRKNHQAIFLFPEIDLAEKYYQELKKLSSNQIILYHSGLSKTQKWTNYLQILNRQAKIIIGSQVAIFSPVTNLKAIVFDSEDHFGFKQDRSPRYDARRVARKLAEIFKAKVIIQSPAPTLESFREIKKHKIWWLKNPFPKTKIKILDLNQQEFKNEILSYQLKIDLQQNFQKGKTALLLLNRKGTATAVICHDCSKTLKCPKCQIALSYYLSGPLTKKLVCHQCNFHRPLNYFCPNCRGSNLRFLGGGTEKLELEVKKLLPQAEVLRIEKDSMKIEGIKIKNRNKKPDIIIGTSKIFTNWFKKTDLVAFLMPDFLLNYPDFRAQEKTFQIAQNLLQYSKSKFIIQTYAPEAEIFQYLKNKSKFYWYELLNRQNQNYPPFSQIAKINYLSHSYQNALKKIRFLRKFKNLKILGPIPIIYKTRKNLWHIYLIGKNIYPALNELPNGWKIDIDPI